MKTKEKQGYSYILSLAALLLALTCAILCGVLPTVAAQNVSGNNFLEENYNMTEEYSALLGEESNLYSSLDKSSQKEVSKQVLSLINQYRKQLLDLGVVDLDIFIRRIVRAVAVPRGDIDAELQPRPAARLLHLLDVVAPSFSF